MRPPTAADDETLVATLLGLDSPLEKLRANTDATTWKTGRQIVKLDREGRTAHLLPVLRHLGLPVPGLLAHRRLDDGRHVTVTRYIDHDPDLTPDAAHWAATAAALIPLHRDGRDRLADAGITLDRYAVSQPARVATRLDRCRAAGGWHVDAAEQLAPVVDETARALDGTSADEVAIHSDLHDGNLLVTAGGPVAIIDWDLLRQGPAEFDLAPLAVDVRRRLRPRTHLEAAYAARPDLDRVRVETLATFKQATAASYHLVESISDRTLLSEARRRVSELCR